MRRYTPTVLGAFILAACSLQAQNTGARATPQTQQSAPASTGAAAQGAQQAESNAAHSAGKSSSRPSSGAGGKTGITGVRSYNAGYRARKGTPAPAGNAKITIIGGTAGASDAKTQLPGMPAMQNALGVAAGTPIRVKLLQSIDSGKAKNGDSVQGVLTAPLGEVPAGAPVQLTVVASAAAGTISSGGELSLQVVRVNDRPILSEVITAEGKEGRKILPDDAPARGTEAVFTADQSLSLPAAS